MFVYNLFKVISERFQSHFSEYALMILKFFLPKFVQLHGQKFSGVLEKFSCTSPFFFLVKKSKTTFLKINVF